MAGMKGLFHGGVFCVALVTLAFAGSVGMTFIILACALPDYNIWWPFMVVLCYILAPLPTLIARRYHERAGTTNASMDIAIFITMGIVVSSFALPIILARVSVVKPGACYLTITGNTVVYLTFIGYFATLYQYDSDYSMW